MLTAFWDMVTSSLPSFPIYPDDHLREWLHEWSAGYVMAAGVPGFFAPRLVSPVFAVPGTPEALSFYDSAPLKETLDLAGRLGSAEQRAGAAVGRCGRCRERQFQLFRHDKTTRIDARHIMASGALPPGLPPIEIDGQAW